MSDAPEDHPGESGCFRAAVRAGSRLTEYLRSGNGRPVVLLAAGGVTVAPWDTLMSRLATRFRTIVPERVRGDADAAVWLRRFVEGLGLRHISLVTEDDLSVPAIGLALADPDRVERVIVLSRCCADDDSLEGVLASIRGPGERPLRIIARDQPPSVLADRVEALLSDGAG